MINHLKNINHYVFGIMLTFAYIFNISFNINPVLSTGRFAFLIMFLFWGKDVFYKILTFIKQRKIQMIVFFSIFILSLFQFAINNLEDSVMLSRISWFLIYSIFGSFLYCSMCRNSLKKAMIYIYVAVIIQSFFVLFSIFSIEFKLWVNSTLVNTGNIDFTDGVRFPGLSNGGGATLSLQLALGICAAFFLFINESNIRNKLLILTFSSVICISTIFVGRTGLYIGFFMIFFMIINFIKKPSHLIIASCFYAVIGMGLFFINNEINNLLMENVDINRLTNWAFDILLSGESTSAQGFVADFYRLPDFNILHFLFGTGRVVYFDGTNYSAHDSGYIQTGYAIGVIFSLSFYIALFSIYFFQLRKATGYVKVLGAIFISMVFLLEVKEPFIFKYSLPFFVFVYLQLASRFQYNSK